MEWDGFSSITRILGATSQGNSINRMMIISSIKKNSNYCPKKKKS